MGRQKRWRVKSPNTVLQQIMSAELGISNILAQLLINRGIYTVEQAKTFLGGELDRLFSPWLMKDMDKAVDRILLARQNGEAILVYGDYDVDGITGSTILLLAMRKLGCKVSYYIPHRLEEGYGLNKGALQKAKAQGVSLVVTVDCGISGAEEVEAAKLLGLDIVITDHHEPPDILPSAVAVVDPKRHDCPYPFKELAGVGVAMKLIKALFQRAGLDSKEWEEYLDLVCLGTVADIVPLQGENRIIVKHGLTKINTTIRPGLQALIKISGFKKDSIGTRELGFGLAPRLNAAGRMGDAGLGVELLLSTDPLVAEETAEKLNKGNQERQQVEAKVLAEALELLESNPEMIHGKAIILASQNWHPGVIGIVASRLVDRFYRPVFMISLEDGKGKGSARSITGFNLYQAMINCQEHLEQFGGHAMAAGFSLEEGKIDDFRKAMNIYAQAELTEDNLILNLDLDALVDLSQLSMDTVMELEQLSPLGHCNPGPILGCCEATVLNCREVGKNGGHLKMRVSREQVVLDGIGFNLASYSEMLATNDTVDMAFVPSINVWNGRTSVQLEVKELKEPDRAASTLSEEFMGENIESGLFLENTLQVSHEKFFDSLVPVGIMELCLGKDNEISPVAHLEKNIQLEDYRNCPERMSQLLRYLNRRQSTMIVAESASQVLQLAHFINCHGGETFHRKAVYHPHMEQFQVQRLIEWGQKGKMDLFITTGFLPQELNNLSFEQVVFFHLPYLERECRSAFNTSSKLILLAGESQICETNEQLKAIAPERDALGELYKTLKYKYDKLGQNQVSLEEICRLLRIYYPKAASHTSDICFSVFQEMGLISYVKIGNNYSFKINSNVRSDLQNSPTYRWALHNSEECQRFQRRFLTATNEQLLELFS